MTKPFEYVTSILQSKKNLIVDDISENDYKAFLTNRSLSYYKDCVWFSNEMNRRHHLDNKLQYDFLINTVRSMKRPFSKWIKNETSEDLDCIKSYFDLSESKAREVIKLLSEEDIKTIKEKTDIGGMRK
jgi:hypothetical protein